MPKLINSKPRRLSVIVATYNSSLHIDEALESMGILPFNDIDVIIVDGGSQDNTLEKIVAKLPSAKVIKQSSNGIYGALNEGVSVATTPWITFLHSDDVWLRFPDLSILTDNPNREIWVGDVAFFKNRGEMLYLRRLPLFPDWALRQFPFIFHPNGIYPRKLLLEYPYDEPSYGRKADMQQIAQLGRIASFHRMSKFCYGFRIHGGSTTVKHVKVEREPCLFWCWRAYVFFLFENNRKARIKSRLFGKRSWE